MGLSCRFSLKPIHWYWIYEICVLIVLIIRQYPLDCCLLWLLDFDIAVTSLFTSQRKTAQWNIHHFRIHRSQRWNGGSSTPAEPTLNVSSKIITWRYLKYFTIFDRAQSDETEMMGSVRDGAIEFIKSPEVFSPRSHVNLLDHLPTSFPGRHALRSAGTPFLCSYSVLLRGGFPS